MVKLELCNCCALAGMCCIIIITITIIISLANECKSVTLSEYTNLLQIRANAQCPMLMMFR